MSSGSDAIKKEIFANLQTIEDPQYRTLLLLLIRSIEATDEATKEMFTTLNNKLDMVLKDEERIKEIALNGTYVKHDAHHVFIDKLLSDIELINFTLDMSRDRRKHKGYCDFAMKKIDEENIAKNSKRKILEGTTQTIVIAIIMFIFGATLSKLFPGVF